ncbi:hypothetical protein [Methylosinus sporium]|uniref:hypothetical protein n=1 Tax=Methylosinus sporium TaxID=428 RepID=UPI003839EC2B
MMADPAYWKFPVVIALAIVTTVIVNRRTRQLSNEVVSCCREDESKIRFVFEKTQCWNIGFGVETLSRRYGVTKDDMKIIVDRQWRLFGESLVLFLLWLAVAGFVLIQL